MNNFLFNIIIILLFLVIFTKTKNKETFSGNYKIIISNNTINLKSKGITYSSFNMKTFESKIKYFNKIYDIILPINNKKKILLLGFGIGAIPMRLSLEEDIDRIDCVEINTNFIKKFKKYFPNYSNKINIINDDAVNYLSSTSEKYDLIIDDLFIDINKISLDYNLINSKLNNDGRFLSNYIENDINLKLKKSMNDSLNCSENIVKKKSEYNKIQSIINCKKK